MTNKQLQKEIDKVYKQIGRLKMFDVGKSNDKAMCKLFEMYQNWFEGDNRGFHPLLPIKIWYDPKRNSLFLKQQGYYNVNLEWPKENPVGKRKGIFPKKYDCVLIGEL